MTHEEQIPIWSYIDFQILYQIHIAQQKSQLERKTIAEVIDKASEHIQSNIPLLSFYSPINAGAIFSFLYSILVVPKELYKKDDKFFDNFYFEIDNYFEIEAGHNKIADNKGLFRALRNSISHANYLVDKIDLCTVQLWNVNPKGIQDIIIKSDINRLGNFAVECAKYYIQKQNNL